MKIIFSRKKNAYLACRLMLIASFIISFTTPSYAFLSITPKLSQPYIQTTLPPDTANSLQIPPVLEQSSFKEVTENGSDSLWKKNQVAILTALMLFFALVAFILTFALITLRQKQKIESLSYAHDTLKRALEIKKSALKERDQLLKEINTVDELTGLFNVRYFDEILDKELRRASRHQSPLSLVLISFDNYPCYIRNYGQEKTEEQLLFLSDLLNVLCQRISDILAYIHEAKFAIILPHTTKENALLVCHKIHEALREQKIPFIASKTGRVTFSIGLSTLDGLNQHINPQHMYNTSEILRLSAEKAGGNRTCSDRIRFNTEQSLLLDR